MTVTFDGRAFAEQKEKLLKNRVDQLREKNIFPKLVSVLADSSPENQLYVSLKKRFAGRCGILFDVHEFNEWEEAGKIIDDIRKANEDPTVHGVMVQLPAVQSHKLVAAINPEKDIDCLTPENLGRLLIGNPRFLPATVRAVVEVIQASQQPSESESDTAAQKEEKWLAGKSVCIVGASIIVGKPLALVLSDLGATVTACRSTTKNLAEFTKNADILISASGVLNLITKNMVRPGAIIIDVGISKLLREGKFRVGGDVNPEVAKVASFVTPVPGGVGPVTVACLFENLLSIIQI